MKKFGVCVLVVVIVAATAPSLLAQQRQRGQRGQRGGGFGGGGADMVSLLTQKSVQDELKLTEDQVKKVTELATTQRGSAQGRQNLSQEERQKMMQERAKTNEKALAEVLKEDQLKRAKQIVLQQQRAQAFANPEVATALKLTDEQKEKIKTITDEARQQSGQLFQRGAGNRGAGNQDELRQKREAYNREAEQKVMILLSVEQKAKWKELTGETFKGEITRARGTRGARPPSRN
jgi:hypothetical protein